MVKLDFSTTTAFKFLPAHATSCLLNSSRGVDVHFQAALCFKDGKDVRDQRPLLYPLGVAKPYVDAAAMKVDDDGVAIRQVKPHPGVQF